MSELIFLDKRAAKLPQQKVGLKPRIAFVTLGCKVNMSDTQKAVADFRAAGWRIVPHNEPAEVYVVNTCSVTHAADRKSRTWLRRSARANPEALVVATGCYAESGRDTLEAMDEVGIIVGYRDKQDLLKLVMASRDWGSLGAGGSETFVIYEEADGRLPSWLGDAEEEYRSHTRAMIKVEDGCNDFCTFCIIPFTRGMPRSTPTAQVVEMVEARLDEGVQEVVLTGVHMGKYGLDHAQRKRAASDPAEAPDLPGVVKAVLERTAVPRLRITSVEPTDAVMLLPLLADAAYRSRLAPHLHLPLQSGCDATLGRMKRDYTTAEYADVVRQCRRAVPDIAITTDLITGFPDETEEEWQQTLDFVRGMLFAKIHVFPYSQRPGTPAALMPGQIHPDVKHARTLEAMQVSKEAEGAYITQQLGQVRRVLWETRVDRGEDDASERMWTGLTDNYLRVYVRSDVDLGNTITPALLAEYDASGLWARVGAGAGLRIADK